MTVPDASDPRLDEPWYGARNRAMRGFVIGTVGYVLIVGVILSTMWFLAQKVATATKEYETVKAASEELQRHSDDLNKQITDLNKQVTDLQAQYDVVSKQKDEAAKAVVESQVKIGELQKRLDQIYDFSPHIVPLNEIDEKMAYAAIGDLGFRLFEQAIRDSNRKLPFSGANDPNVGFTSPGYAQYLLKGIGSDRKVTALKPRKGPPKNGDIITYQPAYYMFYFSIPETQKTFVIGMTPEGVLALDPDFGTRIGVFVGLQP